MQLLVEIKEELSNTLEQFITENLKHDPEITRELILKDAVTEGYNSMVTFIDNVIEDSVLQGKLMPYTEKQAIFFLLELLDKTLYENALAAAKLHYNEVREGKTCTERNESGDAYTGWLTGMRWGESTLRQILERRDSRLEE